MDRVGLVSRSTRFLLLQAVQTPIHYLGRLFDFLGVSSSLTGFGHALR